MVDFELIKGDCISSMKELIKIGVKIDLTVTSPPYDNLRTYNGTCEWNFNIFKQVAECLYDITADGGVVVWVVNDAIIKGTQTCSSFKQALFFRELGFLLNDTMIWHKPNPIPQFLNSKRYTNDFEYMFIFSKGKPKTFNPILEPCRTKGSNNRGRESSAAKDRGNFKGCWKRNEITQTKEFKRKTNTWECPTENKNYGHPAVFPRKLVNDHIISWSNKGELVLDPFMGSGTTGEISILNERNFIGIEIVEEYFNIAEKRIKNLNKDNGSSL